MNEKTLSQHLSARGAATDMKEYQQLKVANDMEREATHRLYEHLKSRHGEEGALQIMKERGYNPGLIR